MATYKEQRNDTAVWVLMKDGELVGVFSNLAKMCRHMNKHTEYKFSRSTLTRKESLLIEYKGFVLQKAKLY